MYTVFTSQNKIPLEVDQTPRWNQIHLIALIGLLIRLVVVFLSDQIYQPDEIFQYLEQAHRLEFGYGIIPWEYRYGIRSWILPGLLSIPLHIFHILRVNDPNIYVPSIKIFACILSISLIYASYIIVRNIASEAAGRLASIFICFWYELVYFASKATPEVLSTYCLVLALACVVVKPNKKITVALGFLGGLAAILRFHYLPAIAVPMLLAAFRWKKREVAISGTIFLGMIALAGFIDYLTWGGFFISYYNNYLYNSVYKVSEIFGVNSPLYLAKPFILASSGIFFIAVLISLLPSKISRTWILLLCAFGIIVPHSLVAHKEYRFIVAAIPFLVMLTAIVVADLRFQLRQWNVSWRKGFSYSLIALFIGISINGLLWNLPFQNQVYAKGSPIHREPILSAYLFLHKEPDLTSVLSAYTEWYWTGGYYYLHRNVPIYYPDQLKKVSDEDYGLHISHIVCNKNYRSIPNFTPIFTAGDLEIRQATPVPHRPLRLDVDTVNIPQMGVDDRFQPTVRSHLN
ncbi:MAG: hypothetical protein VKJ46_13995 [Leptolyngbyaceae bacterium]|nr:hypothetical protein [Leptolyngbyaceae bacterium]